METSTESVYTLATAAVGDSTTVAEDAIPLELLEFPALDSEAAELKDSLLHATKTKENSGRQSQKMRFIRTSGEYSQRSLFRGQWKRENRQKGFKKKWAKSPPIPLWNKTHRKEYG
jgi:hypothetical protein